MPFRMTKNIQMFVPEDELVSDEEFRRLSRGSAMARALTMLRIKKALKSARLELGTDIDWHDIIEFMMLQKKKKRNALLLSNHTSQKK